MKFLLVFLNEFVITTKSEILCWLLKHLPNLHLLKALWKDIEHQQQASKVVNGTYHSQPRIIPSSILLVHAGEHQPKWKYYNSAEQYLNDCNA